MRKVSEYHLHAGECRSLAALMPSGDQRDQLLAMAETWDRLADERERALALPDGDRAANGQAEAP